MRDLLGIGTNRGYSMAGLGIGLGLAEFKLGVASFSPVQISGMELWLDASDSSTLLQASGGSSSAADGDPVGEWKDKSGKARHLSQSDGTRKPALKTAIKNGRNAVRFDGTNDYLRTSANYTINNPFTVFVVAIRRSGGDASYPYLWDNRFSNIAGMVWQLGGPFAMGAGAWLTGASVANDSAVLLCGIYNGSSSTLIQNGTSYTGDVGTSTFSLITLGDNGALHRPMSGDVCEMAFYNGVVSANDRTKMINYLNEKWSIY